MAKLKSYFTKANLMELLKDIIYDIVGGSLYAAGIYNFASKAGFAPGGMAGLSVLINHYTDFPIGLCTVLLNIPVVLICLKTLGRGFLFRSIKTIAISTVLMDVVFPLLPAYTGDGLMAALFAGALSGAGLALIYWRGSSTGGTDFIVLSLRKKLPHISIGTFGVIADGATILLGGLVYKNVDAVLHGFIMTFVCTTVIDKLTAGFTAGQMALIITGEGAAVSDAIMKDIERGVTSMNATGMFSGTNRQVLMCACSRAEACRIRNIVYKLDRSAIVVYCPFETAYGFGFQSPDK